MPLCLYIRCKPQGADALKLVRNIKRVFLGYPAFKRGRFASFRRDNIRECLYDLAVEHPTDLDEECCDPTYRRQVSANLNLIREVTTNPDSLVLVPRPESGICLIGKVDRFELVDRPTWIEEYKSLRERQAQRLRAAKQDVWTNERCHVGDVVQTFVLNELKEIPFFCIPGWIRHQLFGRATAGRVRAQLPSHDPYAVLLQVHGSGTRAVDVAPTNDPACIEERLLNFVTPGIFEHLICELLQLERHDEYWWHVGGPGDGGVDALGFNHAGATVGAAQCKLAYNTPADLFALGNSMRTAFPPSSTPHIFVCSLYSDFDIESRDGITALGRKAIVRLVLKHRQRSTFAKMLGLVAQPHAPTDAEQLA